MKFGHLPLCDAEGAILAHSVEAGPLGLLKKGHLLDADTLKAIAATGQTTVLAALLEDEDVIEDEAAGSIAKPMTGQQTDVTAPFTGRSNLLSRASGLARVNRQLLNKINRIDPSITVATVKDFEKVEAGQMLATIKIIPFSAKRRHVEEAVSLCTADPLALLEVHPFTKQTIGVISTTLPTTPEKIISK